MRKNQKGFTFVHVLAGVVVISLLVFVGVRVYSSAHKVNPSSTSKSVSKPSKSSPKTSIVVPAGYQTFKNTTPAFTISYPQEWGGLTTTQPSAGTTLTETVSLKELKFAGGQSTATLNGPFSLKIASRAGFQIGTGKYGATLEATSDGSKLVWKVVDVNPADTADVVGSMYHPKEITTTGGIKLYDFTQSDEGTTTNIWVMKNGDDFIQISLPTMTSPDAFLGGPNASADAAAYATLSTTIRNTITN